MSRRVDNATSPSLLNSGSLTQGILLLEQIGQTTNLGVLKGFAGILTLVLETCQTATSNKNDARALSHDLGMLALAIAGQVHDLQPDISAELLNDISKLCQKLEAVHSTLKNIFKRDSLAWFVTQSQDQVRLQRLQRDIKHAIDVFSFQSAVRLRERLVASETLSAVRHGRILDEIHDVRRLVMNEIKTKQAMLPPVMLSGPNLPRAPLHFFGRQDVIQSIVKMVLDPNSPARVAILGAAGIGKTSVASMVLLDSQVAQLFGHRRFFVPCDAAKNKDDLLTAIASCLGLQDTKLQKKILEVLGDTDHRSLIVLDNFESPWENAEAVRKEVESLLVSLCSLATLTVIITVRGSERPMGVKWSRPPIAQLGPLDPESARRAFLALSDCAEDDPSIDNLIAAVDSVPLAISLMANLAQTDSPETLLLRWREEQSSLLNRVSDRTSSLDVSIRISLNGHRMKANPEATILLGLLSLLPDGIDNTQLTLIFPGIPNARRSLSVLWQTSLAYNDGHNRTRVLAPIRAHMTLYSETHLAPHTSMLAYYMGLSELSSDLGGRHGQMIAQRLTKEIGNMLTVISLALEATDEQQLRSAAAAAISISRLIRYTHMGSYDILETARTVAQKLEDRLLEADILYHFAWTMFTIGGRMDYEALCTEALTIYESIGNIRGRAECTFLSAQFRKSTKRQKECKPLYEDALKLAVESQSKYCEAKCLSCLAEIAFYSSDGETAERLSREALALFRELDHLTNIGLTAYLLGRILVFRDDRAADEWFDEAEVVLKQAGAYRQAGVALIGKGDSALARCDYLGAQEIYTRAFNAFQEAGTLQSITGAFALLSLGTAAAYLHQQAEAKKWIQQARSMMVRIGWTSAYGILHCDLIDGDLAFQEDKLEEARSFYQRAQIAAESSGFAEEDAQALVKLAAIDVAQHRLETGLQHLVVAAAKQRQTKDVKGLSLTLVRLGQFYVAGGQRDIAFAFLRAAYPLCQKVRALRNLAECLRGLGELCQDSDMIEQGKQIYQSTLGVQ